MQNLLHRSSERSHQQPRHPWMRWIALLCVLLVCVMGTAQVCHAHFDVAPKHNSQQNSTPEDHCPLCVAMHSALPTALHVAPEPMLQLQHLDTVAADAEREHLWNLKTSSRPPPAALHCA